MPFHWQSVVCQSKTHITFLSLVRNTLIVAYTKPTIRSINSGDFVGILASMGKFKHIYSKWKSVSSLFRCLSINPAISLTGSILSHTLNSDRYGVYSFWAKLMMFSKKLFLSHIRPLSFKTGQKQILSKNLAPSDFSIHGLLKPCKISEKNIESNMRKFVNKESDGRQTDGHDFPGSICFAQVQRKANLF